MANTLREYLVGLGFQVNEAQLNRFQAAVHNTAGSAAKLGAEVVEVGVAITDMVTRVARQFEDLYYMAQRNSTTVAGLDAIGFAARQVGLSSQEAQGMVENFGHALRTNPGLQGLLRGMGINTSDPQQAAEGLVGRLKRQFGEAGYFAATRVAGLYGLDERTFRTLWQNLDRLRAAEDDHRARMRAAGLDADEEAGHFVEFTRVLNKVEDSFSILGVRIAHDWREPVQGMLTSLDGLIQRFNTADAASGGLLGKITSLIGALGGAAVVSSLLARLLGFRGAAAGIAGGVGAAVAGGGVMGLGAELMQGMAADSTNGNPMRTALRSLLGIDDPKEPAPWMPGGSWSDIKGMSWNDRLNRGRFDAPGATGPRPGSAVTPSNRWWGDDEAERAGLYDRPGSTSHTVTQHINQTNNINGAESPAATAAEISRAHRELGDALRNMYQKTQ